MHQPGLGVADRQVAVGAALVLVDLDVRGAVHRLQPHRALLDLREVHVVAVLLPVARLLPELDVVEDRRLHLAVAARAVLLAPELREPVPDHHPGGRPEGAPGRELGEEEEPELAPELAVVARARLLEALEMLLELGLREERGPVDAREHGARGVPAPVGAGDGLQLERADGCRRRRVRAAAEVGEGAVGVERDRLHRSPRRRHRSRGRRSARPCSPAPRWRSAPGPARSARPRVRTKGSARLDVRRACALRSRAGRPRRARRPRGTRSRSRSPARSAARSRSSRPGRAPSRPSRARARRRGGSARAPACRSSS